MAMLSNEQINNIRSSVDIVDVISSFLPLDQRGKNYFGVCPFHDDHSPSMSVSKEKQIYTCFSCGATGNVFNFLMDYDNISFLEAVKIVADKSGIKIDVSTNVKSINNNPMYDIYELASKFYQNNIQSSEGTIARKYLSDRDIDSNTIKQFKIGLSIKKRDGLTNILLKKDYKADILIKSGLVIRGSDNLNDIFYNRIMFPLDDINGKTVGFSGRIYDSDDTSKYINTKETEIFKKGNLLYNYFNAKDECRVKKEVIVMEGFMDVIRAYTVGVKNVVATMGTAMTKDHALLLKKLAPTVILCFDGDDAGIKATNASVKVLNEVGIIPKIVILEDKMDPDDFIMKKGKETFLKKLENTISVMDFKISHYKTKLDMNNSSDMASYVNAIINDLNNINDSVLREITINKVSEETGLEPNFLKSKLNDIEEVVIPKREVIKTNKYEKAELMLLYYMLKDTEVIKLFMNKTTYMPTETYRLLASEIMCFYKENKYFDIADFMSVIAAHKDLINAIGLVESLDYSEEYELSEIENCIKVIKEYNLNYEYNRLKNKLKVESDPIKKAEIAKKMVDLKKEK